MRLKGKGLRHYRRVNRVKRRPAVRPNGGRLGRYQEIPELEEGVYESLHFGHEDRSVAIQGVALVTDNLVSLGDAEPVPRPFSFF